MREPARLAEVLRSVNPKVIGEELAMSCRWAAEHIDTGAEMPAVFVENIRQKIAMSDGYIKELLMEWMAWYNSLYHPAASYFPKPVSDIRKLRRGDTIRNKGSGQTYTVIAEDGIAPLAIKTVRVTNSDEWLIIRNKN